MVGPLVINGKRMGSGERSLLSFHVPMARAGMLHDRDALMPFVTSGPQDYGRANARLVLPRCFHTERLQIGLIECHYRRLHDTELDTLPVIYSARAYVEYQSCHHHHHPCVLGTSACCAMHAHSQCDWPE